MDPMWLIVLRVTERIVIYAGAIFMIYLGYSLYKRSNSKGRNNLQAKTKLSQIILPGTGLGLFFMAFGAIVLFSRTFHRQGQD
jgi:threonine/homoserine/homoserine lactone efflux protein